MKEEEKNITTTELRKLLMTRGEAGVMILLANQLSDISKMLCCCAVIGRDVTKPS